MSERPPIEPLYAGHVYFVRRGKSGPIKIGYSRNPAKRIASMQTANAAPLVILGTIPGDTKVEHAILNNLSEYRLRGEWVRPDPIALRYLHDCIRAGTVAALRAPKPRRPPTERPQIGAAEQGRAIAAELIGLGRQKRKAARERTLRENAEWLKARNG